MQIVKTKTIVELYVDEDKLADLITKKKLTNKQLAKFIDRQPLSPYIRVSKAKEEDDAE